MLLLWRFGSNWLLAAHFSSFPRTEQLPVCSSVLLYLRSNLCTTVLLKEILDTRLGKRQFFTLLLTLRVIRAVKNFTFSNLLLFEFLLLCWYAMLLDFDFLLGLDPHRCQLLSTFSSCLPLLQINAVLCYAILCYAMLYAALICFIQYRFEIFHYFTCQKTASFLVTLLFGSLLFLSWKHDKS